MVDLARKNLLHDKLRFFITVSGAALVSFRKVARIDPAPVFRG
jgi:hypothetical protein